MKSPIRLLPAFVVCLLGWRVPAAGQVPDQVKYSIPAPSVVAQFGAQFGNSVAMDGGCTVVGVPYDDTGEQDSGVVKVFDSIAGVLLFVLPNPSPAFFDQFGRSVAISGTRVVVGVASDDTGATDAGSAYVYDLNSATPTVPILVLNNPTPVLNDLFGSSVAISGTRMVVGAVHDSTDAPASGKAYVYDLNSATPTVPMATLNNPSPAPGDFFGNVVAISGTHVVIAATLDNEGANDSGSVYVYDLSSATPTVPMATLNNPSPAAYDYFGVSLAISGTRLAVGAYMDDTGAADAGSVYIYDLGSATPTVPIVTLNNPSPAVSDYFGISVAISGTRVVVGLLADYLGAIDVGGAYVYDLSSATPTMPVTTLNNPAPAKNDYFGWSVAINGTTVVVGAPVDDTNAPDAGSAYVYDLSSATPTAPVATLSNHSPEAGDFFGISVAVSGPLMVVGSVYDDASASRAGSAYVYDLSSATPTVPMVMLKKPGPAAGDYFGVAVAISGTRVVVGTLGDDTGATDAGSVYVYDIGSATPTLPVAALHNPSPEPDDRFGTAVAVNGARVVVGTPYENTGAVKSGSAYVYDLDSVAPTVPIVTLHNPGPESYDYFGSTVAISGARVVVGAPGDNAGGDESGIAYVYDIGSDTPTVPAVTLDNPSPGVNDTFGNAAAISGTRIVVGAAYDGAGAIEAGSAYIYDLGSELPAVPIATLNKPSPAAFENFGRSVAISGTRVVVGSPYDDMGETAAGSAYVFDLSSDTPTVPVATLSRPGPAMNDNFGNSVAIDGATVAIGSPKGDSPQVDKGSAYIFGPSPYSLWKVSELNNQFAPDLGDADSDGVSNLGEYGLLRSPIIPNGAATTAAPALYAEGTRLRMFVPRDPARNDITLEVQATGDLTGLWTTIATSTLGAPFTGPGYFAGDSSTPSVKSVEVRDTVNITDAPQRFLRVRVTH